jgi:glucose/arabinose dehydrogenase
MMMHHLHGSTAIAGVVYYAADHFPAQFRDNIFVGNVVTCRINRDSLTFAGSTPTAHEEPDLLSSDDPWFRPCNIVLGPDGALYVADFYNRIIAHYEIALNHPGRDYERGRIWRIVYRGNDAKPLPRPVDLSAATVEQLIAALSDPNLTVRLSARPARPLSLRSSH